MIFSAFRYALGRRNYIVGVTVDYITKNIKVFDKKWLQYMREEIKEYLDRYYYNPTASGEFECDVERWEELLGVVTERYIELNGRIN